MPNRHSYWHVLIVTFLISGPWQPSSDIDVYLTPLVDDLKTLWEVGVEAYDTHQREFFTLNVILLWIINNFLAYENLFGCIIKGYYTCLIYGEETNSHWLKHGSKKSYTCHRIFLPCNHPFRKQKMAFNGEQEFRLPLKELARDEIFRKVNIIHNSWGTKKVKRCKSFANATSCWKKRSMLFELEY